MDLVIMMLMMMTKKNLSLCYDTKIMSMLARKELLWIHDLMSSSVVPSRRGSCQCDSRVQSLHLKLAGGDDILPDIQSCFDDNDPEIQGTGLFREKSSESSDIKPTTCKENL